MIGGVLQALEMCADDSSVVRLRIRVHFSNPSMTLTMMLYRNQTHMRLLYTCIFKRRQDNVRLAACLYVYNPVQFIFLRSNHAVLHERCNDARATATQNGQGCRCVYRCRRPRFLCWRKPARYVMQFKGGGALS